MLICSNDRKIESTIFRDFWWILCYKMHGFTDNGKCQQFYNTRCHFNIPIQKPTAKLIGCRSVVAGLKHVNWYVGTGLGIRGHLSTPSPMSLALCSCDYHLSRCWLSSFDYHWNRCKQKNRVALKWRLSDSIYVLVHVHYSKILFMQQGVTWGVSSIGNPCRPYQGFPRWICRGNSLML